MVSKSIWQRSFVLLILVAAASFFYFMSGIKDTVQEVDGRLVFTNQYTPLIEQARSDTQNEVEEAVVSGSVVDEPDPDGPAVAAMAPQRLASFDQFRATRLQERARRIETIESMLQSVGSDDARRSQLQQELLNLSSLYEKEEQAEGLLVARGLYDVVVHIGSGSAEVIVPERITRDQAGQIGNVVARVSGVSLNQITIVDGAPAQ